MRNILLRSALAAAFLSACAPAGAETDWLAASPPIEEMRAAGIRLEARTGAARENGAGEDVPWKALFDGSNLDSWTALGSTNWAVRDQIVAADAGSGMLVTKEPFRDFELRLDFKPAQGTNSGVFFRCSDRNAVDDATCYEANIFDSRPDRSGRTGAITNIAPPRAQIDTEGRWNTYEIRAEGDRLVVKLNGVITVDSRDGRLREGPIALQFAKGAIEFRNISIRRLGPPSEAADPERRLAELGIKLIYPEAPPSNYVKAVRTGNLVYLAGHLPQREDGTLVKGKLGKGLSVAEGRKAAELAAINLLSTLKKEVGELRKVARVIKVTGMVNTTAEFEGHPAVINGASDLLVAVFGEARGKHARAAVGMASLPLNVAVEVEMIVEVGETGAPSQ